MSTVVMAIDGNAGPLTVLSIYRSMVQAPDRVILVHVRSPLPDARRESLRHTASDERSGLILRAAKQALESAGPVKVSVLICEGTPADVLPTVAEEEHADLIVVGYGRRTGLLKLLTGSDVRGVERRATVPVIVTPHDNIQSAAKNLNGRESYAA